MAGRIPTDEEMSFNLYERPPKVMWLTLVEQGKPFFAFSTYRAEGEVKVYASGYGVNPKEAWDALAAAQVARREATAKKTEAARVATAARKAKAAAAG